MEKSSSCKMLAIKARIEICYFIVYKHLMYNIYLLYKLYVSFIHFQMVRAIYSFLQPYFRRTFHSGYQEYIMKQKVKKNSELKKANCLLLKEMKWSCKTYFMSNDDKC